MPYTGQREKDSTVNRFRFNRLKHCQLDICLLTEVNSPLL